MARRFHMHPGDPYRIAVIPTRDRHGMLVDLLYSAREQFDIIVVVDNWSVPLLNRDWLIKEGWSDHMYSAHVTFVRDLQDPPNISALWNKGIEAADTIAKSQGYKAWDIAVLNSDVELPRNWARRLSASMRGTSAVLAYPDQFGGQQMVLHREAGPVPMNQRITGYAYMLRGEAGLRLDESMRWWYSDDDLDWTARINGGSLLVPGLGVVHKEPNASTNARPDLSAQAGLDRQTFAAKWGRTPH